MSPPEFSGARYALAIAIVSFVVLYVVWVFSRPDAVKSQLFYGAFVAFILVFGTAKGFEWIDYRAQIYPRIPLYVGILTPMKLIDDGSIKKDVKIQIGKARAFLNDASVLDDLLKTWSADRFTVDVMNDKILVSTQLRDENDKLVAELDKNEWKVSPTTWDRNYTINALEVKDARGDVILQVHVLPGIVQIQGVWWLNFGINGRRRMVIREIPDGSGGVQINLCAPGQACLQIEPMFKYPSENHLGELR